MFQPIPPALLNPINEPILSHLASRSAHTGITDALLDSVRPLGDVQVFCPDPAHYRYVAVSSLGVIFGFAAGMSEVVFRLDLRMKERALVTGGIPCPACGDAWIGFTLFRDDWPQVDLRFWARKA